MKVVKLLGVAVAVFASVAGAEQDNSRVAGANCSAKHPEVDDVQVDSDGFRAQANGINVYCPLVRTGTQFQKRDLAHVAVGFDQLANSSVTCTVYAKDLTGGGTSVSVTDASLSLGGDILTFSESQLLVVNESDFDHWVLKCVLDNGDVISGYTVRLDDQ